MFLLQRRRKTEDLQYRRVIYRHITISPLYSPSELPECLLAGVAAAGRTFKAIPARRAVGRRRMNTGAAEGSRGDLCARQETECKWGGTPLEPQFFLLTFIPPVCLRLRYPRSGGNAYVIGAARHWTCIEPSDREAN